MAKKSKKIIDTTTEEKIKAAAKIVFQQKGYAATRTRDIAEKAGINLALLNYYFRSKEKLFDLIMLESLHQFLLSLTAVINNENSTLDDKIIEISSAYIDLLTVEPQLPLFIMSEMRNNATNLAQKIDFKQLITTSVFAKQFGQGVADGKIVSLNFMNFFMNLIGMCVFPFIASPMLKVIGNLKDDNFINMMQERKNLIPIWVKSILYQQK